MGKAPRPRPAQSEDGLLPGGPKGPPLGFPYGSKDGGESFRPIPSPDPAPGPLALSPSDTLYLGGKLSLWRRTEAGWRRIWQGGVLALAAHPQVEGLLA
ncbi:hypothetical protein [Thermus tengchongensis]|uniref:hypothetical protein n=1 Tax=Thermus tengchongensis TaxID=1214928 RepID=UPI001F40742D|nr:hypothetical protein [Thermus tengchongensis]